MIADNFDIVLADLVHEHIATCSSVGARASARLVFIHRIWNEMTWSNAFRQVPCAPTAADYASLFKQPRTPIITDFKTWLVAASKLTDASGRPLIVLSRGSESEQRDCTLDELGASWVQVGGEQDAHFIVDRRADPKAYEPITRKS